MTAYPTASTPRLACPFPSDEFANVMDLLIFDNNPARRQIWSRLCEGRPVHLHFLESAPSQLVVSSADSRVIIYDQSVMDEASLNPLELIAQRPFDVLAFTIPRCSASLAARLVKHGAQWVFDSRHLVEDGEEGLVELMQACQKLDVQVKHFHRAQSLRSEITEGERAVLELVIRGVPNKQIAKLLGISIRTVESRRSKVYRKCEVHTVTELVRFFDRAEAMQKRFLSSPAPQDSTSIRTQSESPSGK